MNLAQMTGLPFARALACGALCALSASAAWAQGTIAGRVTVAGSGEPVASARVIAVGTNSVATSAQDGRYMLKYIGFGPVEVQVLRVGFQTQKKTVTVQGAVAATADFQLAANVVKLAEVVTTGTGEQRTVELGYTTSTFGDVPTRMEQSPTTLTIGDLIVQKAPSVTVLGQGMIGTASAIRIRGLNSLSMPSDPIVIVDGIHIVSNALTPGSGVGGSQTSCSARSRPTRSRASRS
jgi:hypothetical protein